MLTPQIIRSHFGKKLKGNNATIFAIFNSVVASVPKNLSISFDWIALDCLNELCGFKVFRAPFDTVFVSASKIGN